jgi:hypothetical protein
MAVQWLAFSKLKRRFELRRCRDSSERKIPMSFSYTVRAGDNLSASAKKFGLPNWQAIYNSSENQGGQIRTLSTQATF